MVLIFMLSKYDGLAYFIAPFPEGDYVVPSWDPAWQNGYCGAQVTFLLENGTFKTVKGPYKANPKWGTLESLANHLSRPELLNNARTFKVVRKYDSRGSFNWTMKEIVYTETIRSIEPIKPKILKKWHDLDIAISDGNGGTNWMTVRYFLKDAHYK